MDNLGISLADYQHGAGFDSDAMGQANLSADQLADLSKALEAGSLLGSDQSGSQTTGGSLKVESLERNLKVITFKESDIKFWKRFPKAAAFNTVEEYNQLVSYGTERGGFNNEGELPEEEDSTYQRRSELVKYLGVTRSVTHQMQLVKTNVGNVFQKEVQNGIMWILRKADRALFWGDAAVISQEWNGLYAQHMNNDAYASMEEYYNSDVVVDLRGKILKEESIEEGAQVIVRNFGQADLFISAPVVLSDFATGFYARKRINVGQSGAVQNAVMGQYISKFQSMYGIIEMDFDIYAAKPNGAGKKLSSVASSAKAPAAPTSIGVTVVTGDGLSKFADGVADYFYAVAAVNRYGESALTQTGGSITVANATDAVDLEFTATAGPYAPTAYVIYRTDADPSGTAAQSVFYPIMTVPASGSDAKRGSLANGSDGASAGEVRDRNRFLPKTEEGMLLDSSIDVIQFKQLAPLMKMDLAKLSPADRFMVLLYGTPFMFAPNKVVRYINIGRDAS
jgi:hypothetical protein